MHAQQLGRSQDRDKRVRVENGQDGEKSRKSGRKDGRFRGDVEGLRAVAIGAVLLYHAEVATVSGGYVGVDIFFVVSGFLITGVLLRELDSQGTVSLARFYARRARRLLPSTVVVLLAVVLAAWLLMSPVDRKSVFGDVIAAGLYVTNWQQAAEAADYSALGAAASPVQHFWSLAVEEQFYLVWPLVVLAVAWWCRRRSPGDARDPRPRLAVALAAIAVSSFGYSVYLTDQQGGAAYFSTFTRGWELAVGGLLALVPASRWRWPRRVPGAVALAGMAFILVSVLGFTDDTRFPGYAALLPVLGAAAVIGAGASSEQTAIGRLLTLSPMRYVGRISYVWYLWHWPAIVFATVWLPDLSTPLLLLVVAVSWIPAAATHRLVEEPFRLSRAFAPTRPALRLGAACTAGSVVAGSVAWVMVPTVSLASPDEAKGAKALRDGEEPQTTASALRPVPEDAENDRGPVVRDGCLVRQKGTESGDCVYGDRSSDTTVVLFGDSHAMQYSPALIPIAEERGWRLVVLTKSSCTAAQVPVYNAQLKREYTECQTWREHALDRIDREDPALVITGNRTAKTAMRSGRKLVGRENTAALEKGYVDTLWELKGGGAEVVMMADNPYPPWDMPSCVSDSLDRLTECAFPESDGLTYEPVNTRAAHEVADVRLIDPAPVLCPEGTCRAVIGNVIVYRNAAHITATYMRTLRDWLDARLPSAV